MSLTQTEPVLSSGPCVETCSAVARTRILKGLAATTRSCNVYVRPEFGALKTAEHGTL